MAKTRRSGDGKTKATAENQTKLSAFYSQSRATTDEDATGSPILNSGTSSTRQFKQVFQSSPQTPQPPNDFDVEEVASPPGGVYNPPNIHANLLKSEMPSAKKLTSIFDIPIPVLPESSRVKHARAGNERQNSGPLNRYFGSSGSVRLKSSTTAPKASSSRTEGHSVIVIDDSLLQEDGSNLPTSIDHQHVLNTPIKRPSHIRAPSIIVIDETPPRPAQETHPFFRPKRKVPIPVIHIDSDGESAVAPSERRSTSPTKLKKSIQPVAPWPDADSQHVRPTLDFYPSLLSSMAYPFPSKRQLSRRPTASSLTSSPWYKCLQSSPPESNLREQGPLDQPMPIPQDHLRHPALSRFESSQPPLSQSTSSPLNPLTTYGQEQWSDKYRPKRASEVLGNDINAQYIKAWLSALELDMDAQSAESRENYPATFSSASQKAKTRGTKRSRPLVVRTVDKSKRKRKKNKDGYGAQDWIVNSDDEDEVYDDTNPNDVASFDTESQSANEDIDIDADDTLPNSRALSSQPAASPLFQFDFSTRLTNALLVAGPPGTGKTSAVYACAAELGWTVFEASPGSGKRTGALMSSIFDGVGKNHTLNLGSLEPDAGKDKQKGQAGGLDLFFGAGGKAGKKIPPSDVGTEADPINLDVDDPTTLEKKARSASGTYRSKGSGSRKVNQSIILLEEVDVLFQNEGGFWPAVINIIKESRRPVIMTCNDASLVPVQELPLQTTLGFEPCPASLAASYLRRLSHLEGFEVEQHVLEQLYSAPRHRLLVDYPDQPMHPVSTHSTPVPDLRHAIQQTQILCRNAKPTTTEAPGSQSFERLADWTKPYPVSLPDRDPILSRLRQAGIADDVITLLSLWKFSDSISFANCVDRRLDDYMEAQLIDDYDVCDDGEPEHYTTHKPSFDDLLGHTILHKPIPRDRAPTIPFYARDEEIALEIAHVAHRQGVSYPSILHRKDPSSTSPAFFDSNRLFDDRAQHQSRVLKFVEGLLQLSSPLLPRAEIFVDYVPYIRQMVLADDIEKEAEARALAALEASARANGRMARTTRNSQRSVEGTSRPPGSHNFVRYVSLKDDELQTLHESAFSSF